MNIAFYDTLTGAAFIAIFSMCNSDLLHFYFTQKTVFCLSQQLFFNPCYSIGLTLPYGISKTISEYNMCPSDLKYFQGTETFSFIKHLYFNKHMFCCVIIGIFSLKTLFSKPLVRRRANFSSNFVSGK